MNIVAYMIYIKRLEKLSVHKKNWKTSTHTVTNDSPRT